MIPYNAAITALGHTSRWQQALQLLARVGDSHLQMSVVTIAAATTACDRGSKWQQALHLLARAREERLSNVVSYGAAISACEQNEEWQQALDLLDAVLTEHMQLNAVICSALAIFGILSLLCSGDNLDSPF